MYAEECARTSEAIEESIRRQDSPTSRRILSLLGPPSLHGCVQVVHLSLADLNELSAFVSEVFVEEPLGSLVGLGVSDDALFIRECIRRALVAEQLTGVRLCLAMRVNGCIVAAAVVRQPVAVQELSVPEGGRRLEACLAFSDAAAERLLGRRLDIPELMLGAVDARFRGSLLDEAGARRSVYQQLCSCVLRLVRASDKGWWGLFSHSNDTSAARHEAQGWRRVCRLSYAELPTELTRCSIQGALSVCLAETEEPGAWRD